MVRNKEERESLRERMRKKIVHAKHRGHISEREIYALMKEFFSELLKLEYEFTHEELVDELKKTYLEKRDFEQAKSFIEKIGVLEFTSSEYTQEELKTMVQEFEDIVLRLAQDQVQESWFAKLQKKFFKKKEQTTPQEDGSPKLENLIHQIKNSKANKQELYHQAISEYESLPEDKKALYYTDLLGIYYDLKKVKTTTTTKEEMKEFEEGLHLEQKPVIEPDAESETVLQNMETAVSLDMQEPTTVDDSPEQPASKLDELIAQSESEESVTQQILDATTEQEQPPVKKEEEIKIIDVK